MFSDGGCDNTTGRGAWACVVRWASGEAELSGYDGATTNNRMELTAALEGLGYLAELRVAAGGRLVVPRTALLVSDSRYVVDGLGWLPGWVRRS